MSMAEAARTVGWYGKLPTVGDFASRRLDAAFIDPWDHWLGSGLQAQRDRLGDAWLDPFLQSPAWRFVLGPGVLPALDPQLVVAGVLMPSVDRVGRYFPLTLAGVVGRGPGSTAEMEALLAWIDGVENTALEALQADWTIDELERHLAALPPPVTACSGADALADARQSLLDALAGGGGFFEAATVTSRSDLASLFGAVLGPAAAPVRTAASPLRGVSLWMADGQGRPQLAACRGLPTLDAFARMFGGQGPAATGAGGAGASERDGFDITGFIAQPAAPATAAGAVPGAARSGQAAAIQPASAMPSTAAAAPAFDPEATAPLRGSASTDDPLAWFQGAADVPFDDPLPQAPPRDDILSMFGATGQEPPPDVALPAAEPALPDDPLAAAGIAPTPVPEASHDELLALFERAQDGDTPPRRDGSGPDILDILGAPSPAPAPPSR